MFATYVTYVDVVLGVPIQFAMHVTIVFYYAAFEMCNDEMKQWKEAFLQVFGNSLYKKSF